MIKLLVADDHIVLREGLCELLENKCNFDVVAQATDGSQIIELVNNHGPDVVIMDVQMPHVDGIEAMRRLSTTESPPPVLMLSANEGERTVRSALKAGAKGFISKNAGAEELKLAIEAIIKGQTYLSPSVTSKLMAPISADSPLDNPLDVLTDRETEVLKYLADGLANREIGKLLHISTRTVDTHRSNILKKLNAKTNAELVKFAIANDLISI